MKKGRLYKYLSKQEGFSEELNEFRGMDISLIKKKNEDIKLVENIEKTHKFDKSAVKLVKELNRELKKRYSGKYRFGFINGSNKEKNVNDLRIPEKYINDIKHKLFETRDKLEKIKNNLEKSIKNN